VYIDPFVKWVAALMLVAGLWMAWTSPKPLDRARAQRSTEREVALLLERHERTDTLTTAMRKAKGFESQPREEAQGYTQPRGFPTRVLMLEEPLAPPSVRPDQEEMTAVEKRLIGELRAAREDEAIFVVWCEELSPFVSLTQSALRKSAGEDFEGLTMIVLGERGDEAALRIAVAGSGIEVVSSTHY
jgi:hypothetical protein